MRRNLARALFLVALIATHSDAQTVLSVDEPGSRVTVVEESRGCFHYQLDELDWALSEGLYRFGDRSASMDEMMVLRRAILESREPGDTLAEFETDLSPADGSTRSIDWFR